MIPRDWTALPMWTAPLEAMSAEAISLMCDADRRPTEGQETLLVRLNRLPLQGGED